MQKDRGLDTLLDLDGVAVEQIQGFWVKFESAYQLLEDLFISVDEMLDKGRS